MATCELDFGLEARFREHLHIAVFREGRCAAHEALCAFSLASQVEPLLNLGPHPSGSGMHQRRSRSNVRGGLQARHPLMRAVPVEADARIGQRGGVGAGDERILVDLDVSAIGKDDGDSGAGADGQAAAPFERTMTPGTSDSRSSERSSARSVTTELLVSGANAARNGRSDVPDWLSSVTFP